MKLQKAILFIFAFTLFMAALNTSGIFDSNMPSNDTVSISSAKITELTQQNSQEVGSGAGFLDTIWGGVQFLGTSIKILGEIVNTILSINSVMADYGIPSYLITMFYGMLILITVLGLLKLISGRSDKGIE